MDKSDDDKTRQFMEAQRQFQRQFEGNKQRSEATDMERKEGAAGISFGLKVGTMARCFL